MNDDYDIDQRIAADDDETILALAEFHAFRPHRTAWRDDADEAPLARPVYAREPDSLRVIVAMRDEEGWVLITRDGECRPLAEVAAWAPLAAALG